MTTSTNFPHAWAREQRRVMPVLKSFALGLALLFGVASQALASIIHVPADQPTIADAIAVAVDGDEIVVAAGTYNENVAINKNNLILRSSAGAAATIIQGVDGHSGTVHITNGINGVTIGGIGTGFTIVGYDGNGVIERAAIYLDGAHNNTFIIGNIIQAAGEHGLAANYNAAINGLYIMENDFTGQTFIGAEPGGCDFSTQFNLGNNVPRQLVVLGGGSGVTNTKNIYFIKNNLTGSAGGFNSVDGCEIGNSLVTIDVVGAVIAENTFDGITTRFANSLRARGKETSIYCNTFKTGGLGANCVNIFFGAQQPLTGATPNTLAGVATSNAFPDGGAYLTPDNAGSYSIYLSTAQADAAAALIGAGQVSVAGATTLNCPVTNTNTSRIFPKIQMAISAASTIDGHTITVDAGTYAENITVNKELDIRGPNYNISPNGGPRVAEAIIVPSIIAAGGEIFMVKKSNVSINGFTIDGDNTSLNSTWIGTNGADIDAAEGVTIYDAVPVVNNLSVSNNIIQNLGYFGVTLFGNSDYSDANTSKTGHVIANNLIRNMGYYGTGNGFDKWGGGVLLYNSHYAKVEDNVITNVRIGIQTGNYQTAHTGDPQYQVIDNNQIETRYLGIFFNLHNYSPWTVSNNTFTGKDNATEAAGATRPWRGMLLASLGNGMGSSTFSDNTIDASGITSFTTGVEGINVWNVQNASSANITGGSISGVKTGIFLNNFEGYASNATLGAHATISKVTITASDEGVRLLDSPNSTSHANVEATVTNCFITGGTDGAILEETVASKVTGTLNNNSITGQSGDAIIATTLNTTVDATCNWYGSTNSTEVAALIQGNVDYISFLTNGTDNDIPTAGFQPVPGSCDGVINEFFVNDNDLTGDVYTTAVGNDANPGTPSAPFATIGAAIAAASAGHTIKVDVGTYNQEFDITKDLTLQGAGMDVCTVSGPIGGLGHTMKVLASGVTIDGFTITRDGNNPTDWNSSLNTAGIAIQGQTVDAEIKNCRISGNRTAIDVNNSNDNNIHNNIITLNRTGLIFRNQTDNTTLIENEITDNYTVGIVFLDASSGTNNPVQSAINSNFNENRITGNWYGQIVDRQSGGSLPLPGNNLKNFECNWYGSTSPVVSTNNSSEPGGSSPFPTYYGGPDNPPVPGPEILGQASANFEYLLYLVSGTDNLPSINGFQPTPLSCTGGCPGGGVVINANTDAIYCSIQTAIDDATSGDRLRISTGTYTENVDATSKNIIFVPGNSPGCVTINGDYTLNAGDVLEMEIEGTTPCTEHDQLIVTGTVTLGGATLTLIPSMFLATDMDVITLIDGSSAIVGKFAQGNFVTDGQNTYYINYAGGMDGFDVVLTKCCGALVDLGIFTTIIAPVDNMPPAQDVLAGHKLLIKARPTMDMVNAIYTQGTFTLRTLASNGVVDFAGDNVHSAFGYTQIGSKQTIGLYDYFIFNFENGNPTPLNWLEGVEYDLLTLTYSCAKGNAVFELVLDADAPVGGTHYQEINGETNPGAQGIFYVPSVTGPGALSILASSNSPVCETMQIDLNSATSNGSPAYTYLWDGPNMYSNMMADPASFVAVLASAGVYQVTVTEGNGCTATSSTSVDVPATGACVKNENTVLFYPTITQAIDAVATDDGHVLTVPSGTWPENVVVDKGLTINGANVGVDCDATRPAAESIITGGAGIAVSIASNGVTIDGFTIEGSTGVSAIGQNRATVQNNKINAREIGIASSAMATAPADPYALNHNCISFPEQAYDQQGFAVNPTLGAAQAANTWYTDRYAPAGFVASVFGGGSRLKHSINAADCQTCRPASFQTAFYNTQGRKYDVAGTTAASIQLYVPSDWATSNNRMAGFWGTAVNVGNGISYYPIIEFSSDGNNPRFRFYDGINGVFVEMGLPTGFAYDQWYTLNIAIDGANIRYNVGDLSLILPANGSVSLSNVILQGHNTAAPGVTYDIYWDNLNTHGNVVNHTAASVGIALVAASGTEDVILEENNVTNAFYGYLMSAVNTTDRTTVKGGVYTDLLQGVSVVNTLDGVNYLPSTIGVENATFSSFSGNYPNIPAANFHAGVYAFTGGASGGVVDVLVENVTVENTGKTSQASAGIYMADFSSGAGNRLNTVVNVSTIRNNLNRGVEVRGNNAATTVSNSIIEFNGSDPFGAGGNDGFGVYAGVGSQVTLNNNFIKNPAAQAGIYPVTAMFIGVAPAASITAFENSIDRNGNGSLTANTFPIAQFTATCNWWSNDGIDGIDALVDGNVTFVPYLNNGTDDNVAPGFQPVAMSCVNPKHWFVNDNALTNDLFTLAIGNDLNQGTKRRPFLTIGKAINTIVSSDTVYVDAGDYNEQAVLPDTKNNVQFIGVGQANPTKTRQDFTGTVTGKPTLFDIAGNNTKVDGFYFKTDLTKLHSAIIASDNLLKDITILNNYVEPYQSISGTYLGGYGPRNAFSINYPPYRVGGASVTNILVDNNTVTATVNPPYLGDGAGDIAFRSAVSVDDGVGVFTRNTFQSINHEVLVRFAPAGDIVVGGSMADANTFTGGGVQITGHNSGTGTVTVSHNSFDGSVVGAAGFSGSVVRLQNNNAGKVTTVANNTFNNIGWGMSIENYPSVTVSDNIFNPLAGYTNFRHITVNTKCLSSDSPTILQVGINGTVTGNTFNSLTPTVGGTALSFYNHDERMSSPALGTFTIGGAGPLANIFAKDFTFAALMSDKIGNTLNHPDFPEYSAANIGAGSNTTMACWDKDVDLTNNTFDVGSGAQMPLAMNHAQRVLLEAKLYHKPDNSCLGKFFQTVEVMAKVFLQGPFDSSNDRMIDALRSLGDFPLAQPHDAINALYPGSFVQVNNSGSETITAAVRDVVDVDNSIVDWVWLELRDKNDLNTTLYTRSALVQRDGDIVDLDGTSEVAFPNAYQDNYYLMVRHRNHLAAMTADLVDFSNPPMVDFTTASLATFGSTPTSARRLIKTNVYGLWAGNTFPKETLGDFKLRYNGSSNDRAPILTKVGVTTPLNIVTGYHIEDVNLNGQVKYSGSNNDRVIILNNIGPSTPLNTVTQQPNN